MIDASWTEFQTDARVEFIRYVQELMDQLESLKISHKEADFLKDKNKAETILKEIGLVNLMLMNHKKMVREIKFQKLLDKSGV